MSDEWTAEELIACLKMFKNTLIQNNGHHYMREWEYQLLDGPMLTASQAIDFVWGVFGYRGVGEQ